MAEETIFLDERGVLVTNSRIVTPGGDTYSLSNVTSCKPRFTVHEGVDKKKGRLKQLLFWGGIVVGIIAAIYVKLMVGIVIAAIGIIASLFIKSTFNFNRYQIYLGSASGESQAIEDGDEAFIDRIAQAVNEAIVARG